MRKERLYQRDDVNTPFVIFKRLAIVSGILFVCIGFVTYVVVKSAGY